MLVYRRVPGKNQQNLTDFCTCVACPSAASASRVYPAACSSGWWLSLPLWKIWVRQLGWWHSQYMGKQNMFQTTNQMYICGSKCRAPTLQCQALKTQQISTLVLVWMNNVNNQDATPSECSSTWISEGMKGSLQGSQCSESRASHHENALRALQLSVRLKVCWIETATYGPTIGECNPLVPCHSSWAHRNGAKETCFFFPSWSTKIF